MTTHPYSETRWLEVLLAEYDTWTDDARAANGVNALWLGRAQASMAIGVGYLFTSVLGLTTPLTAEQAFLGSSIVGVLLCALLRTGGGAIMTDTKSGRELEPERTVLGSERARRFFKSLGFGPKRDGSDSEE